MVARRLGDKWDGATTSKPPTSVTREDIEDQIGLSMLEVIRGAESREVRPIVATGTITVAADPVTKLFDREYDLDASLKDSDGAPNFRGRLFIERTDLDNPLPAGWPEAGDYRVREFIRQGLIDSYVSTEELSGDDAVLSGNKPYLYMLDERTIGYVKTPTETQTLTCYYAPSINLDSFFADQTKTLATLGLRWFDGWINLITLIAAEMLQSDMASPAYALTSHMRQQEWLRFIRTVGDEGRVAYTRRRSRWTA